LPIEGAGVTIDDVLGDYQTLPEYLGLRLSDVNQVSLFGDRPMNVAATRGSIDEMEVLTMHGARVNEPGEHGYTPLHNAVEQSQLDAVRWLLTHGADKSVRNSAGETPGDLARVLFEEEIVAVLER
jgi:uncharacterized protein